MIGDIRKFRFWCQKVLPLVYDNSLSYYEVLCKVVQYLNGLIEDVNKIPEYIDSKIEEALTDEHIIELLSQFIVKIQNAISANNEGTNTNASKDYNVGQMLWLNDTLYKVIRPISAGATFIVDTNIEAVDFETLFNDFVDEVKHDITANDDGTSATATQSWTAGQWLWLNDILYIVKSDITEGNAYVFSGVNANVEQTTVEDEIKKGDSALQTAIQNEATTRADADNALHEADINLQSAIDDEATARAQGDENIENSIGDLDDLNTTDKTKIVSAINEVLTTTDIQWVTPQMFGALGDGVHDDTSAIQQAINTRKFVYFPQGIYRTTAALTMVVGTHLMGKMNNQAHGNTHGATILRDGNGNTITIGASTPCVIENLLIDKVNSVNNGIGIDILNTDNFQLKNVRVINHQTGISVNGCSFGEIEHCVCERNYGDGFYFTSNSTLGVCQVQVEGCLSELNDGCGYHYVTRVPSMPVGIFSKNMTFANSRGGVVFERVETGAYITGIKIDGCFIGSDDYLGGVYIGCTNYPALIDNCYFEEAGMSPTGREYNTAASHNANAITLAQATRGAMISNCAICTSAKSGISCSAGSSISNCNFENNGVAPDEATIQQCDIHIVGGFQTIMNNMFMTSATGIYNSSTAQAIISGNIFNNTTPIGNSGTNLKIKTNIGVNDN